MSNLKLFRMMLTLVIASFAISVSAQTVKGVVKDESGEAIIGATVMEKGTKNGTTTNIDGNFTLKVSGKSPLIVSYIGMTTQEISVAGKTDVTVILKEAGTSLNDVVVVGYTSKARKDLTGSVGSVSGVKLAAVPVASAAEALQGKIAGVQVTTTDGQPGADINIRVRGATSVTQSNDPLYIVDGFQTDNINDIPTTDIASIDVLKDASLTAIYGAKGGNGVVIVTTKSAQTGKVQVGFNGRLTVAHLAKKLDLMNTADFIEYSWDRAASGTKHNSSNQRYFRDNFGNPMDLSLYRKATTHDWQDEVMGETPLNYSANVTVGGGNDKVRFNTSLTQSNDDGIIMGSGVRRTNLNIKLNAQLARNLMLTINPRMTYRRDEGAGGDNIGTGGVADVLRYRPTNGLREFASWNPEWVNADTEKNFEYTNPKNDIQTNQQLKHTYTINNQAALQWNPIDNLILRTEGNFSLAFRDISRYYGPLTSEGQKNNALPVATTTDRHTESYTWTNTATYNMTLDDVHNMSFLLGQEIYSSQYKEKSQTNRYFPRSVTARKAWDNMGMGTPYQSTSMLSTPNRTASFFGQATYNYDHRYFLAVTMRADGSSKFSSGNQWGYFPSVSGAWDMKNDLFKNINWIDQVKLRASWGMSGNNRIDDDMWRFLYGLETSGGPGFGETTQYGEMYYSNPSKFPNTDIKWETTIARNIAFDISLFGGRLTVTPEAYWNTTRDLLYESTIPSVSGYQKQMQNIGKVTNNGFELTINGDILRGKDYVLSANLTFGHNKMTVKELNNTDNKLYNYTGRWYTSGKDDYLLEVGGELGLFYGFVYDGLYSPDEFDFDQTQDYLAVPKEGTVIMTTDVLGASTSGDPTLPGKIKFKDLNGDGQITLADRTVIGRTTPKMQGGFGLSGQWKDFDFTANFTYMLDFDVYNATAYALSSSSSKAETFTNILSKFDANSRWHYTTFNDYHESLYKNYWSDGAVEQYLEMNAGKKLWTPGDLVTQTMNSYFVEDGSFLRCSDITVGYTLPSKITKNWGVSKLRAYLSASNLFLITGYSGYDPEVDIQSGLTPNMDYNRYPRNRAFSFGLNVTF